MGVGVRDWVPRPTLTGPDYTSQAVYEEERERLFFGGWVCIGRSEEVPSMGDYLVRDVVGESVFVVRNREGALRAFYNICAHRGTKLLDDEPACGHVGKAIKCPYHAWAFDLDGRLLATPNVHEDELFSREDYRLHPVAVDEHAGFLFVNLADSPRPLREHLRDSNETILDFDRYRMGELRLARRITYDVAANWKIVVENYNECLHCPQIHPELVQVIPLYRKGEVWDGETRDGGNEMRPGATSFTATGTSDLPKFPDLDPEDYGMYYGAFQFPNLMVNLHPDSVMAYLVYPRGVDRTTVVSEFYFRPEALAMPGFDPGPTVDLWDLISRQDWAVCERAQIGVSSRAYRSGVYPRKDRLLFDFNERWRRAMGRPTIA
ncbi:MAG TPA: aromatic ring-hydroxylating dioxygenase subunit alpha [Candidatus Binatia bacterium]|nr:aromatic ring-hydroxylating dioxygenase subunit alpha [Candidatus Binatia bacterium]